VETGSKLSQTLAQREQTHGGFRNNSRPTQELKEIFRKTPGWDNLHPYEREALDMIVHKIGRILAIANRTNDPTTRQDAWHDVAGYATLAEHEGEWKE
jgi:hypothetical protein